MPVEVSGDFAWSGFRPFVFANLRRTFSTEQTGRQLSICPQYEESTEVKTSLSAYNEGSVVLLHLTLSAQQQ